jgi:amidase
MSDQFPAHPTSEVRELDDYDATGMAELVRSGQVHPRELVAHAIARAVRLDPTLNSIVHRQFDRACRDAEKQLPANSPFPGVPFLFKDYKCREAGEPYHMGVRALRDLDYRPRTDSELALRFRAAGLIPLGRTNTAQMAMIGTTEPELYGPTHNPWDATRMPGGSSGGSAAAVAARIVPAAHGNDISGSIRIPAALCGLVGLKATRGRVLTSARSDRPVGMNVEGVITRSVRDTAALLDAIATVSPWWPAPRLERPLAEEVGREPGPLRVGVWTTAFNGVHVDSASAQAATDTATLLESMGHIVSVSAPSVFSDPELWTLANIALAVTGASEADAWPARIGRAFEEADLEPRTWAAISAGRSVSGATILSTIERLQELSADALAWWDDMDLLVTPTTAGPASIIGDYMRAYESGRGSAFTRPMNVTGQPCISLPLGWPDDGLPRGVQLTAAYGREDLVIRVASALEAAAPWAHRHPPVS